MTALVGSSVLLVSALVDGDAVRSIIWLAAVVLAGSMLLKDWRARAQER